MNSKIVIGAVFLLLIFNAVGFFWLQSQQFKMAYIDTFQVFESFDGKKELQKKFDTEMAYKKQILDSMKIQIQSLQQSKKADPVFLQNSIIRYQSLDEQFQTVYQEQNKEYMSSIEKQINEYTTLYAKQQGYDYVFGANGNGSLMYANQAQDITQNLIKFINEKYAGK